MRTFRYMHNLMIGKDVPNEWAPKSHFEDEEDEEPVPHLPEEKENEDLK